MSLFENATVPKEYTTDDYKRVTFENYREFAPTFLGVGTVNLPVLRNFLSFLLLRKEAPCEEKCREVLSFLTTHATFAELSALAIFLEAPGAWLQVAFSLGLNPNEVEDGVPVLYKYLGTNGGSDLEKVEVLRACLRAGFRIVSMSERWYQHVMSFFENLEDDQAYRARVELKEFAERAHRGISKGENPQMYLGIRFSSKNTSQVTGNFLRLVFRSFTVQHEGRTEQMDFSTFFKFSKDKLPLRALSELLYRPTVVRGELYSDILFRPSQTDEPDLRYQKDTNIFVDYSYDWVGVIVGCCQEKEKIPSARLKRARKWKKELIATGRVFHEMILSMWLQK